MSAEDEFDWDAWAKAHEKTPEKHEGLGFRRALDENWTATQSRIYADMCREAAKKGEKMPDLVLTPEIQAAARAEDARADHAAGSRRRPPEPEPPPVDVAAVAYRAAQLGGADTDAARRHAEAAVDVDKAARERSSAPRRRPIRIELHHGPDWHEAAHLMAAEIRARAWGESRGLPVSVNADGALVAWSARHLQAFAALVVCFTYKGAPKTNIDDEIDMLWTIIVRERLVMQIDPKLIVVEEPTNQLEADIRVLVDRMADGEHSAEEIIDLAKESPILREFAGRTPRGLGKMFAGYARTMIPGMPRHRIVVTSRKGGEPAKYTVEEC